MSHPYETYKHFLEVNRESVTPLWKEVRRIVEKRQLNPVMNDTKWIELQTAMKDLPFPPPYIVKCITDPDGSGIEKMETVPDYFGDWSAFYEEGLPPFFNIEWIKICPRYRKFRGRLIEDEIMDETPQFLALLTGLNIAYEEKEGMFLIYGYR